MSQLINTFQAAEFLDYHPQTVRNLAKDGVIPAIKRRHKWLFDRDKLEEWFFKNGNTSGQQIADL